MKQPLPESFKASYRRHDGQKEYDKKTRQFYPGLLCGFPLLPLKEIRKLHSGWRKAGKKLDAIASNRFSCFPHETVQAVKIHPAWFPILDDKDGNHLAIDLSPGLKGRVGQLIVCGRRDNVRSVLAWDLGQLVSDIAAELLRGNWKIEGKEDGPILSLANPYTCYLVDIGLTWSRHKLGMSTLSSEDQAIWDENQ